MEHLSPMYRKRLWIIEDMLNAGGLNDSADLAHLLANAYPELYEKLLQLALAFFQQKQRNFKGKVYDPQNMTTVILSNKILIFLKMLSLLKTLHTSEQNQLKQDFERKEPESFIEFLKTQTIHDIRTVGTFFSLYSHSTLQQRFLQFIIVFMEQLCVNFKNKQVFNINVDIAPFASEITTYLRTNRTLSPLALV